MPETTFTATCTDRDHRRKATATAVRAGVALVTSLASACAHSAEPLSRDADASARSLVESAPESTGEWIYDGAVYSQDTTRSAPLFRYDRRVRVTGPTLVSTHITRDASGRIVVTQVAEHDSSYRVRSASVTQRQTGVSASVRVAGDQATFSREEGGHTETRSETLSLPLVVGPTLFGFIGAHWSDLLAGARVPLRFAVLERNQSIGFVLERLPDSSHRVTFRMTPSNWVMRRAIAPTYFHFDAASRHVQAYEGRVPPLEQVGTSLRALDARVRYTFHAAEYR